MKHLSGEGTDVVEVCGLLSAHEQDLGGRVEEMYLHNSRVCWTAVREAGRSWPASFGGRAMARNG